MGASLSLFTAAISLAPVMPTVCWIWPEMPTPTYRSGAVLAPERPMIRSSPSHSKSARLLVQPTTAPSAAARSSARARSSRAPKPRPAQTIAGAASRLTTSPSLARRSRTFTFDSTVKVCVTTAPAPGVAPSVLNVLGITANTLTGVVSFSRATVAPPKA